MTWDDVSYHLVDVKSAKIDRLLSTLRESHVNGGAIFACFEADDSAAFEAARATDSGDWLGHYHAFLRAPSVAEALPELQIPTPLDRQPEFKHTIALAMEGVLTHTILCGGAYERFDGNMDEARQISRDFMEELVAGRWLQHSVAISHTAWTEWFFDVAWDTTLYSLRQ